MGSTPTWVITKTHAGPNSSIDILPDDVLLEVFHFCRVDSIYAWNHKRRWYKLIHTCRRWRHIILSSPSRLDLQLRCTYYTPVEDMLSHSPPFPICVDYHHEDVILSMEDEEDAFLALQKHGDRICFIDLQAPVSAQRNLFAAMDGPFPALEVLALGSRSPYNHSEGYQSADLPRLPRTFQAPRLRHLSLHDVGDLTNNVPLLASFSGLESLELTQRDGGFWLPLDYLVSCLSSMPHLEYLSLESCCEPERRSGHVPNVEQISLSKLTHFIFIGSSPYLEGLATRISAPRLLTFNVPYFFLPESTLPYLSGLLSAAPELRFPVALIKFLVRSEDHAKVNICMSGSAKTLEPDWLFTPFEFEFWEGTPRTQVAWMTQFFASTSMLSTVETLHLGFDGKRSLILPEDTIERSAWHDLLRLFRNVKKLQVDPGLMEDLALALCPDDNEPSVEEILPELRKLVRPHHGRFRTTFNKFIAVRKDTGQNITKRRRPPDLENRRFWARGNGDNSESDLNVESDGSGSSTDLDSDTDFDDSEDLCKRNVLSRGHIPRRYTSSLVT